MKYYYLKSLEKILGRSKQRKLILYKLDSFAEIIYKNLLYAGKDIEYFVSDSLTESNYCNKEVKQVYDLIYEEKGEVYILVFALNGHANAYETLINMGLEFEEDFCIYGMGGYSLKFDAIDSLLGFTRKYESMWGFKVYGDESKAGIKIMTLGGSTSDPTMGNYKSWPEFLFEKVSEEYNVVVYSGGLGGYSINQEFMKFIRDGLILKPDILITFDGYNDAGFNVSMEEHPYLHRYQYKFYNYIQQKKPMAPDTLDMRNPNLIVHGLKSQVKDNENWIIGVRKIHAIAVEFGIQYYSFFQPMIPTGKAVVDESIDLLREEYFQQDLHYETVYNEIFNYGIKCQKEIDKYPYITNLTNIFDGEEDVYYDMCHCTDKGNYIIMNHIYDVIVEVLEEMV